MTRQTPEEHDTKNLTVTHGFISHHIDECSTCEDCIKTREAFEQAKADGTLDKLLQPTDPQWSVASPEFLRAMIRNLKKYQIAMKNGKNERFEKEVENIAVLAKTIHEQVINSIYRDLEEKKKHLYLNHELSEPCVRWEDIHSVMSKYGAKLEDNK